MDGKHNTSCMHHADINSVAISNRYAEASAHAQPRPNRAAVSCNDRVAQFVRRAAPSCADNVPTRDVSYQHCTHWVQRKSRNHGKGVEPRRLGRAQRRQHAGATAYIYSLSMFSRFRVLVLFYSLHHNVPRTMSIAMQGELLLRSWSRWSVRGSDQLCALFAHRSACSCGPSTCMSLQKRASPESTSSTLVQTLRHCTASSPRTALATRNFLSRTAGASTFRARAIRTRRTAFLRGAA